MWPTPRPQEPHVKYHHIIRTVKVNLIISKTRLIGWQADTGRPMSAESHWIQGCELETETSRINGLVLRVFSNAQGLMEKQGSAHAGEDWTQPRAVPVEAALGVLRELPQLHVCTAEGQKAVSSTLAILHVSAEQVCGTVPGPPTAAPHHS